MMEMIKPLVLFLLLMSFVSAAQECGFGFSMQNGVCIRDLLVNASTIVIAIAFLLIGLAFMLGQALGNTRITRWSETELYELLGTAVILTIYLSGSAMLDKVIGPAFYNSSLAYPSDPPREGAGNWASVELHVQEYLQGELNFIKDNIIKSMLWLASLAGITSTISLIMSTGPAAMSLSPLPAFGGVQQFIALAMGAIAVSAVQLQVQLSVVKLWPGMFSVLLPLGIIFRAFPFTRMAGSAAIAIAIGFTIILPISYLLVEDISTHYWNWDPPGEYASGKDYTACSGQNIDVQQLSGDVGSIVIQSVLGFSISGIEGAIKDWIKGNTFRCLMFKVVVEAAILPFFAYLVTLNVTRRLAEILGAHIDFSTLVRVI